MDNGMIVERVYIALRPIGMTPICVFQISPPLAEVSEIDRTIGRREHQRAGIEHVRQRAGIFFRIRRNFGEGSVAGGADELLELPVRDWSAIDPEAVDRHVMSRRFFWIMFIRAHAESAAGNEDHVWRR